jgi:uncharacterized membrane protein YdjX (TVP38/TMEM64 family)
MFNEELRTFVFYMLIPALILASTVAFQFGRWYQRKRDKEEKARKPVKAVARKVESRSFDEWA